MKCSVCNKKTHSDARSAMIALANAASLRACGENRHEVRFYPCPASGGFHLTSDPAPIGDRSKYAKLSAMVIRQADSILSRA
jgi:hypothetical protein